MAARTGLRFLGEPLALEGTVEEFEDKNGVSFGGYALKWENVAEIRDFFSEFKEQFSPGAFKKTITERGPSGTRAIKLLRQHNQRQAQAGKFLSLYEDSTGLAYEAETIDTSVGQDLAVEIREGTLHNMSIMFDSLVEEYHKDRNLYNVREAKLYEISPVLWGAYESSTVEMRSFDTMVQNLDRLLASRKAGSPLTHEAIGQLSKVRATISQILITEDSEPGDHSETAPVEEDHARELDLRLRFAEQELGLT